MEPPFALPTQVELWYLDRYSQAGPALSIATAWRLTGPVDVDALSAAVDALEARHESLRCHFEDDEGVPRLRVGTPAGGRLRRVAATPAERDDPASAVERICTEPFDLATGPLFRAALLTFAPQDHVLVLNVHHIVADAWSLSLLEADLATAYCAARDGTAPPPPAAGGLSGLVRSCLAERDGPTRHRDLEYWTGVLDGVPPRLALPGHPAAGRT